MRRRKPVSQAEVGSPRNVDDVADPLRPIPFLSGTKWGFRDRRGRVVIPPEYDEVWSFVGGFARVRQGQYEFCLGYDGRRLTKPLKLRPRCGPAVRRKTSRPAPAVRTGASCVADVPVLVKVGNRFGFRNKHGTVVIQAVYESARPFSEGLAAVRSQGKWGFVNGTGALDVPCLYNRVTDFRNGIARVEMGVNVTRINRTGHPIPIRRRRKQRRHEPKRNPYAHVNWESGVGYWPVRA
jgi:hypothetical protein